MLVAASQPAIFLLLVPLRLLPGVPTTTSFLIALSLNVVALFAELFKRILHQPHCV